MIIINHCANLRIFKIDLSACIKWTRTLVVKQTKTLCICHDYSKSLCIHSLWSRVIYTFMWFIRFIWLRNIIKTCTYTIFKLITGLNHFIFTASSLIILWHIYWLWSKVIYYNHNTCIMFLLVSQLIYEFIWYTQIN